MSEQIAYVALSDGTVFEGIGFGKRGVATGEVVFNTAMTGYQEILTDPSYAGQIVTMTYPEIGNYGVNPVDPESRRVFGAGLIVRNVSPIVSNYRGTQDLNSYLVAQDVVGIRGLIVAAGCPGSPSVPDAAGLRFPLS